MIKISADLPQNFRNLWKFAENVWKRSCGVWKILGESSEIFRKWLKIFGKSSKMSLLVCLYNK